MTLYSCFFSDIWRHAQVWQQHLFSCMVGPSTRQVCTALWVRWTLRKPGVKVVPTLYTQETFLYPPTKEKPAWRNPAWRKLNFKQKTAGKKPIWKTIFIPCARKWISNSRSTTCFLVVDSKVGWKSIKQVLLSYNTMYTLQGDQDKSVSTVVLYLWFLVAAAPSYYYSE